VNEEISGIVRENNKHISAEVVVDKVVQYEGEDK